MNKYYETKFTYWCVKFVKIYDAICSLVLRRGFLIRCAILVYIYIYLMIQGVWWYPVSIQYTGGGNRGMSWLHDNWVHVLELQYGKSERVMFGRNILDRWFRWNNRNSSELTHFHVVFRHGRYRCQNSLDIALIQ